MDWQKLLNRLKSRSFLKLAKYVARIKNIIVYKLNFNLKWISLENPSLAKEIIPRIISIQKVFEFQTVKSAQVNLEVGVCFLRQEGRAPMLIKESTFWQPIDIDLKIGLVPRSNIPKLELTAGAYIVPIEKNFYHWMFDVLPYIIAIHKSNENIILVGSTHLSKFQLESFNEEMVITECDEVWVNANNVVLPLRRHETGFPSVEVLRILRQHFSQMFEFEDLVERKRIYVSRRNASRAPSNEKEIEETLELIGFQIIDCNEMTLFEQFKAFREAEIVVGPHGAGLSNVIFCEPGVKIIELIPPAFHNPCYREISSLAGFYYEAFPYEAFSSAARIIKEVEESIS